MHVQKASRIHPGTGPDRVLSNGNFGEISFSKFACFITSSIVVLQYIAVESCMVMVEGSAVLNTPL